MYHLILYIRSPRPEPSWPHIFQSSDVSFGLRVSHSPARTTDSQSQSAWATMTTRQSAGRGRSSSDLPRHQIHNHCRARSRLCCLNHSLQRHRPVPTLHLRAHRWWQSNRFVVGVFHDGVILMVSSVGGTSTRGPRTRQRQHDDDARSPYSRYRLGYLASFMSLHFMSLHASLVDHERVDARACLASRVRLA